ncbi:MAG: putative sugar nucleotidyl transferase [Candidatus Cloacimonadota bacterium]|nr:putative sugar nucleotidyl transferase [Candidatus Cloacimonadota bacterium]
MEIVLFDDDKISNFYPLTFTRILGDLRCGILKNRQRILAYLNSDKFVYVMDSSLLDLYKEKHPSWQINEVTKGETLFVNSRIKITKELSDMLLSLDKGGSLSYNSNIVGFKIDINKKQYIDYPSIKILFQSLSHSHLSINPFWNYTWDFIAQNHNQIIEDYQDFFYEKDNAIQTELGVSVINPYEVWIGEGTTIKPGVVLDATTGPIIIDEDVSIMANAVIEGPVYIGKKTKIKIGAKIYEGTSIGPICKVGGEIEETIIQGYSNKQHDGFLGHSFLGEWVNLGADTNNSDLKNNYKNVKMHCYAQNKQINTNCQFVGCVIGDHSKTGINVSINTGTVIGIGCNLFGSELFSGFVSDFSWGKADSIIPYKIDKFFETVVAVKERRNLTLLDSEKVLYNKLSQKSM